MDQVGILQSGFQLWSKNTIACTDTHAGGIKVAFCSPVAVYVHDVKTGVLESVLAGYDAHIQGITWSPHDYRLLVTSSKDGKLVLWDYEAEKRLSVVSIRQAPQCVSWMKSNDPELASMVAAATAHGSIILWNATKGSHKVLVERTLKKPKDNKKFTKAEKLVYYQHTPVVIRCNNHSASNLIACGFKDGRVDLICDLTNQNNSPLNFYPGPIPVLAEDCHAVVDLQWDPLSPYYIIVAYASGPVTLALWDCSNPSSATIVQQFNCESKLIAIGWQSWSPGSFVSVSEKSKGVIEVWNVSHKNSIDVLHTGIGSSAAALEVHRHLFVIPMTNGDIHVFDAKLNSTVFQTTACHRETIFTVRYSPKSHEVFATCSYDGSIKIWSDSHDRIGCLRTFKHSKKESPITYCISWSPTPYDYIAACSYTGFVSIWNTTASDLPLYSKKIHSGPVYTLDWNKKMPQFIASASGDKSCLVCFINLDGGCAFKVCATLKHPDMVFGCNWCTSDPFRLATGCMDGIVRIWNTKSGRNLFELRAHTARVFNVMWNPLEPNTIASGSDDKTVSVWQVPETEPSILSTLKPMNTFHGHTRNVRALLWSHEFEWLLFSGSWDASIRIWNTKFGTCVACIVDHQADVYGLDAHPARPFRILSTSRDTTIRFWNQTEPKEIGKCMNELLVSSTCGFKSTQFNATCSVLHGVYGKALYHEIKNNQKSINHMRMIFSFFSAGVVGMNNLWALLDGNAVEGIVHTSALVSNHRKKHSKLKSYSQQSVFKPGSSVFKAVVNLMKEQEFEKACEYLIDMGLWDKALSIAPSVSMEYWRVKSIECARTLDGSEESIVHFLATNDVDSALDFYAANGQHNEALLVAQAALETSRPEALYDTLKTTSNTSTMTSRSKRDHVAKRMADMHMVQGHPVKAACALLSIEDFHGAMLALVLGSQVQLAFSICQSHEVPAYILDAFAKECEKSGNLELSLYLLRKCRSSILQVQLFCARFRPSPIFRSQNGLRDGKKYLEEANELIKRDTFLAQPLYCASGDLNAFAHVIVSGLEQLTQLFQVPNWDIAAAMAILEILQSLPLDVVECDPIHKSAVMAFSSFVGAHRAMWFGYYVIVPFMFKNARILATEAVVPVSIGHMYLIEIRYRARCLHTYADETEWEFEKQSLLNLIDEALEESAESKFEDINHGDAIARVKTCLMNSIFRTKPSKHYLTRDLVFSKAIPNGNIKLGRRSILTGRFIRGPVHELEDGERWMALGEAVMWNRTNPFSPLSTGKKLFPVYFTSGTAENIFESRIIQADRLESVLDHLIPNSNNKKK